MALRCLILVSISATIYVAYVIVEPSSSPVQEESVLNRVGVDSKKPKNVAYPSAINGENQTVAHVHAKLGEPDRAVELLRRMVKHGHLSALWERDFDPASVPLPESEAFDEFLKEYEALEQRLRGMY